MAGEAERVKSYLETVARLEPDIALVDSEAAWTSMAISLKRIADSQEEMLRLMQVTFQQQGKL